MVSVRDYRLLDRFIDGMQFSVEFTVSRLPMRLQHRAAEMAKKHGLGGVLFPNGPPPLETDPKLPSLRWALAQRGLLH